MLGEAEFSVTSKIFKANSHNFYWEVVVEKLNQNENKLFKNLVSDAKLEKKAEPNETLD